MRRGRIHPSIVYDVCVSVWYLLNKMLLFCAQVPNPNHTDTDHPTLYDNWLLKMEWTDADGNNLNIPRYHNVYTP